MTSLVLIMATVTFAGWKIDTRLPALTTFGLEGHIPDLNRKIVLIDFWASWCGPCKASFQSLETLHRKYADQGVVVLAVNQDKTDKAMQSFLSEHPVTFPIVRDAKNRLVEAADISSMPSSFLVDRNGIIRYFHTGFHGAKTFAEYEKELNILLQERKETQP